MVICTIYEIQNANLDTYILIWIVSCIVFPVKQVTNIMSTNSKTDDSEDEHDDVIDEQPRQVTLDNIVV